MSLTDEFERHYRNFEPPPEAPTFEPTEEEFAGDPVAYINKIRPIAEKYGVIKIKPPPSWAPPFSIDIDKFEFTPRIQKLNELEAISRIRMNFLNRVLKFWHLQGSALKVPLIDGRYLDLYKLHMEVGMEGGLESCTTKKKWSAIAKKMNLKPTHGIVLRQHYEKLLNPFDLFQSGKTLDHVQSGGGRSATSSPTKPIVRGRMSRKTSQEPKDNKQTPRLTGRELRNLKFQGKAGPKAALAESINTEPKKQTTNVKPDPMDNVLCRICNGGDDEDRLLLCDSCDGSFHTYCLLPPLKDIPKGDWRCPHCVAKEVEKPSEAYGFEQAASKYTLHSFGEMADRFKSDYFGMPCHDVPLSMVEKEFWRQVISPVESVSVEYGADLFSCEVGSGFPRIKDANLDQNSKLFAEANWNLNNLPILNTSLLGHITTDISGMMVPWVYVGMCFSTFCWHTEDHWSNSINYLHWGEGKRWYGVSGYDAEQFEKAMKEIAPELFESQPDLLHHIVTIMNPRVLMDKGVKIWTVNQQAGEFVVTFPRAYHAGFNQGYNFAEAVNFAPADWLSFGRNCVDHYGEMKRQNVFAHDELVCGMAGQADKLEIPIAVALYKDMIRMVEREREQRRNLLQMGIKEACREYFELIKDDDRQCCSCKTTCFMSAMTCACQTNKLVCLKHVDDLCEKCEPNKFCLRYRYTLDELKPMLDVMTDRTKAFDDWVSKVKKALNPANQKPSLVYLRELVDETKRAQFPTCEAFNSVNNAIRLADRCCSIADQLVANKIKTRTRQSGLSNYSTKLRLEEVQAFATQIEKLPCTLPQEKSILEFIGKVRDFQNNASIILEGARVFEEDSHETLAKLNELMDTAIGFDLQLPQLPDIKQEVDKYHWLVAVDNILIKKKQIDIEQSEQKEQENIEVKEEDGEKFLKGVTVQRVKDLLTKGLNFKSHTAIEIRMAKLQNLITTTQTNEQKVVEATGKCVMSKLRMDVAQAVLDSLMPVRGVKQPAVAQLVTAVAKTSKWLNQFNKMQTLGCSIFGVEDLVQQARNVPLSLQPKLGLVEAGLTVRSRLLDKFTLLFNAITSPHSMAEIVTPRTDLVPLLEGQRREVVYKKGREQEEEWAELTRYDACDNMVATLDRQEQQECHFFERLRTDNRDKREAFVNGGNNWPTGPTPRPSCICGQPPQILTYPRMLQCHQCCDMFHVGCVYWHPSLSNLCSRYVCCRCVRGTKPHIQQIQEALDEYLCGAGVAGAIKVDTDSLVEHLQNMNSVEVQLVQRAINKAQLWLNSVTSLLNSEDVQILQTKLVNEPAIKVEQQLQQKIDILVTSGIKLCVHVPNLKRLLTLQKLYQIVPDNQGELMIELESRGLPLGIDSAYKSVGVSGEERSMSGRKTQSTGKRPKTPNCGGCKRSRTSFHEDHAACDAPNCLQPIGDEVNWIQCEDGCESWFHILCVGLTVQTVHKIESYSCYRCTPKIIS